MINKHSQINLSSFFLTLDYTSLENLKEIIGEAIPSFFEQVLVIAVEGSRYLPGVFAMTVIKKTL